MGREDLLAALLTQLMGAWSKSQLKASGLVLHVKHTIPVGLSASLLQSKDFMAPGMVATAKFAHVPLAAYCS